MAFEPGDHSPLACPVEGCVDGEFREDVETQWSGRATSSDVIGFKSRRGHHLILTHYTLPIPKYRAFSFVTPY